MEDNKEKIELLLTQRREWLIDCLIRFVEALQKEITELKNKTE